MNRTVTRTRTTKETDITVTRIVRSDGTCERGSGSGQSSYH